MSAATIRDVAHAARASAMTVSRVINGSTRVDAKVRDRVRAAIVTLQYQVNQASRSARTGSLRIGLPFSIGSAPFMNDFAVGAMDQCTLQGARLILENCGDLDSQRAAIGTLIDNRVDAILMPPPLCDLACTRRQLAQIGMPTVAIASARPATHDFAVRVDDYAAATAMMQHLLTAGHRDIAFIKGDPSHAPARMRFHAYLDAMGVAGLHVRSERVADGMLTYRSGLTAARRLLGQPDHPTAVFASNDDMAAAALAVAHGMDLRVPHDLAICGFDDALIASTVWPKLTTMRQPIDEMARAAVQLAIEAIGAAGRARHSVLPYTLVIRGSSVVRAAGASARRR